MASLDIDVKSIFDEFSIRLDNYLLTVKDTQEAESSEPFNQEEFWKNFEVATSVLSHEATALCLAFESPTVPPVDECKSLVEKIEDTVKKFMLAFHILPVSKGLTMYDTVHKYVISVLEGVKDICTNICSSSSLQNTGSLSEKCEFVNQLPKDNKEAVLSVFQTEMILVGDAIDELSSAIENGLANDSFFLSFMRNGFRLDCPNNWTEPELLVVHPCLGLIKALRACLKRTYGAICNRGNASEDGAIQELDEIAILVKLCSSSLVDDLVEVLYPPATYDAVQSHALILKAKSTDLLTKAQSSHYCSESDKTWIEFLLKAVDHNFTQINDRVPPLL